MDRPFGSSRAVGGSERFHLQPVATQLFLRDGDSIIAEARSEGTMSAAVRGARVRESRQQGGSQLVAEPEAVDNESGQMPAPSPRVGTKGPSAKTPFVGDLDVAL